MTYSSTSLAPENHLDEQEARWFAVYTRYKREKQVRKRLEEQGIECYLPLQRLVREYTRKRKQVELPLISCYIFTKIRKAEYVPVLETEDVVQFLHFSRNLIAIPNQEIQVLRHIVGEQVELEARPITFQPGALVEITQGRLIGLRGKLIEKQGTHNFLVELNTMGYGLHLQVDPKQLKVV